MPRLNGAQLAVVIKQQSPTTPVVMLTGSGEQLHKQVPPGVDLVVAKPITLARLRAAMAQVLTTNDGTS